MVVFLWSLAVFLASVLGGAIIGVTLQPKYKRMKMICCWFIIGMAGFALTWLSYSYNLYNDTMGILGLSLILCISSVVLYKDSTSVKLFTGLMAALISNVVTFMFCGTTDTLLGARLSLFTETPYTVPNILFFIVIKLIVYGICFRLYFKYLHKQVRSIIDILCGEMWAYVPAPAVSVVGFYVINLTTNALGIFPNTFYFFPIYLTICIIFVMEYHQIFSSVGWNALAMKNEAELNVAKKIQEDMLPCIFPAFPGRTEFDIRASMIPAKEVGGDFYDFFLVDEDHLIMVVADVSGKGVPAAMFMVIAKTLLKNSALNGNDPREVLQQVNNQLCENNEAEMFVTVWMGKLQISTGKLIYANAGHEYPILKRGDGDYKLQKERNGFVLAGMENMRYKQYEIDLEPNDWLFLYSDGVPEATNLQNELFGNERMLQVLNQTGEQTCDLILTRVQDAIDTFVGKAPQFDDITKLSFVYKGRSV